MHCAHNSRKFPVYPFQLAFKVIHLNVKQLVLLSNTAAVFGCVMREVIRWIVSWFLVVI